MCEKKTVLTADELLDYVDPRPVEVQNEEEYRRGYFDGWASAISMFGNISEDKYKELDKMLFDWKNRDPATFELPPV